MKLDNNLKLYDTLYTMLQNQEPVAGLNARVHKETTLSRVRQFAGNCSIGRTFPAIEAESEATPFIPAEVRQELGLQPL